MPFFSIVIPAYKNEEYLGECIESILGQSFDDWEAIVVIDGSPDNSLAVVKKYAATDNRIKIINKIKNEGTHLARRSGVLASSGEFIYLLDADDRLSDEALGALASALNETDADVLHYGINVIGVDINEHDRVSFESYINKPVDDLCGIEICQAAFDSKMGFQQDWRITQRVFKSDLIKRAFIAMTEDRLGRAQDGYEYFVVSSLSNKQITRNDIVALDYYYGRGVNADSELTAASFLESADHFQKTIDAINDYAAGNDALLSVARSGSEKLYDLVMNDWLMRLSNRNQLAVLPELSAIIGGFELAKQLSRLARDKSYESLMSGSQFDSCAPYISWLKEAQIYSRDAKCNSDGKNPYMADARKHVAALGLTSFKKTNDKRIIADLEVILGRATAAKELYLMIRDDAYRIYSQELPVDSLAIYYEWLGLADSVAGECDELELSSIRHEAVLHLNEIEHRMGYCATDVENTTPALSRDYEKQDIRIFVTTHKDVNLFHSNILQPVQVGASTPRRRLLWALQDDNGVNISQNNAMFCELTTQYWAWKNVEARYYGFCHYRRYFDFSSEMHLENPYGEVMDGFIDWDSQKRYGLDDKTIAENVYGFDVITTGIKDLKSFPENYSTPYDHYSRAPYLKIEDLDRLLAIVKIRHPDYSEDVDSYISGHFTCFCNMYIMRKELFFRYCEWMFPLLEEFCKGWDTSKLSHETLRTPGHLSERLFNIWLMHEKRVHPSLKHKQVQCVHFEHPEHLSEPTLGPIDGKGKPVVPVVFSADNNYVPMVTTTVCSMLENASKDCFYDVIILEKDFTERNKTIMSDFFSRYENSCVRFVNVAGIMKAYDLQTSNEHISVETYYRFLIQKVLPGYKKVLYLDSDLVVEGDISDLFATELGDNLIGAARDIDYLGNLNMNDSERIKYSEKVLGLKNPYDYFQAGVLVLNTAEMRKLHPFQKWLEIAAEPKYIYDDQDILNAHCQGRVTYLDNEWNVMNDCGGRIKKVFSFAPADVFDSYMAAYSAPKILHYAGFEKPWKPGPCDMSEAYWRYARLTPFYEMILGMKFADKMQVNNEIKFAIDTLEHRLVTPARAISETSPLRKLFDGVLPYGSRRREVAKSVVRKMRGRK